MLDSITGFHLEPTNICTLKCPRCPRTNFLEQFGTQKWNNLNLDASWSTVYVELYSANVPYYESETLVRFLVHLPTYGQTGNNAIYTGNIALPK